MTVTARRVLTTPGMPRTVLLGGLGLVAVGLLAVTVAGLTTADGEDEAMGPAAPIGTGTTTASPDPGSQGVSGPGQQPPTGATGIPPGPLRTALRSADADLCLDLRDTRPSAGSEATLAICSSSAETQQWLYEEDGLLRNGADQELCLNSRTVDGSAVLASCGEPTAEDAADVRYDVTVQGHVIPRWDDSLAVVPTTPVAGTSVVAKIRDESTLQNWLTDAAQDSPRSLPIVGGGRATVPPAGSMSARRDTVGSAERDRGRHAGGRGCDKPGRADSDVREKGRDKGPGQTRDKGGPHHDRDPGGAGQSRCDDVRLDG